MRKFVIAAAMLFASALGFAQPAAAQNTGGVSGINVGAGVSCAQGDYEFRPGSGTPTIDIEGCLPSISAGYVVETDSGWTFVFGAEAALGEFERCVRDGNAIVQCLRVSGINSIDLQAGHTWSNGFGLFASVGYQQIMFEYEQDCGLGAAYTSGHCRNAGGANGYNRTAEDTIEGWTYGAGMRFRMSPRFSVQLHARYQSEEARERPYDGPDGNGNPLNPIRPDDTGVTTFTLRLTRALN